MKPAPPIIVRTRMRDEAARAARTVQSLPAARYVLAVIALGALYASLRPFAGWRPPPQGWFAFLSGPVPLNNPWDLFLNVVGYVPLGFLAVLALVNTRRGLGAAAGFALLGCIAFSFGVETLQSALPTRTSSLVDLLANAAGALIGVLAACLFAPWLLTHGGLLGIRHRYVEPGWRGDVGLALLAGWMVALLAPRTLLFGNGDARLAMGVRPPAELAAPVIASLEATVCIAGLIGFALLLRLMLATGGWRLRAIFLVLVAASLAVRATGFGLFWTSTNAFMWLTPGTLVGLALGVPAALLLIELPRRIAAVLAAILVVATTVTVNLAPPNPYLWTKPRPTRQHELAPLSLTTRTTAMAWPAAALGFALAVAAWPVRRRGS